MNMDIKNLQQIENLAQMVDKYNLTEIEVTSGEEKIIVKKDNKMPPPPNQPMIAQQPIGNQAFEIPQQVDLNKNNDNGNSSKQTINSPMVGVFYSAQSPESKPFVSVGSSFKKGDVICIIEAMKVMNEITAEKDGIISSVLLQSGDVVEYGQPLFEIQ